MKTILFLICAVLFGSLLQAQPINLGAAADYAVLGLQNTSLNMNNVTVQGRTGVCQGGSLTLSSPSAINGNLWVNTGATYSGNGTISGSVFTNQNLAQAQIDAVNAATAAAALTPTQTFSSWAGSLTVNGNGGVNVISVANVNLGGGNYITLNGGANDYWIINITGKLVLASDGSIKAGGATSASKILINVVGTGNTVTTQSNSVIQGTLLAVNRDLSLHCLTGPVIVGGSTANFQSGGTTTLLPSGFKVVPCNASSISSNFNGTAIAAGTTLWFNAHINLKNTPASGGSSYTVTVKNALVNFTANGQPFQLDVPGGVINFSASAVSASTSYSSATNTWTTTVPISQINNSEIFLTGLPYVVPAGGLPGGIGPVTLTGDFSTTLPSGPGIQWQWSAAVYTQFSANYNNLNVQVLNTALHAGAPQNYLSYVTGGARGGGSSNYTGSWSATVKTTSCPVGTIGKLIWRDLNRNSRADDGAQSGINGKTIELWSPGTNGVIGGGDDVLLSTAVSDTDAVGKPGYYLFDNLSSGSYYVRFPLNNGSAEPLATTLNNPLDSLPNSIADANGYTPLITIDVNGTGNAKNYARSNAAYSVSPGGTLPASLLQFEAQRKAKLVYLAWTTGSEQNNKGFYLQRKTGAGWEDLAFVFAQNAAPASGPSYAYKDSNNFTGSSWYRLKQVDRDDRVTYSVIRQVAGDEEAVQILVYPNPSKGAFTVRFENKAKREIRLRDAVGNEVRRFENYNEQSLYFANLTPGLYFLDVTDVNTGFSGVKKIVVR